MNVAKISIKDIVFHNLVCEKLIDEIAILSGRTHDEILEDVTDRYNNSGGFYSIVYILEDMMKEDMLEQYCRKNG